MKINSEKELCEKFIRAHPRPEHLYFEVHMQTGRADIVHSECNIVTIYEAKMRLSIELLEQCINRRPYAHFVYAVVPQIKKRKYFMEKLFEDYGIGIISIDDTTRIYNPEGNIESLHYRNVERLRQYAKPKFIRNPQKITLYEENKKEVAGVRGNSTSMTPFKIMVKDIKYLISSSRTKKVSINQVFESQRYYTTLKQFKTNIYQWIRKGVITGIEMEKGMLWLVNESFKEQK